MPSSPISGQIPRWVETRLERLIADRLKAEAVRLIRQHTGLGVKEALNIVNTMIEERDRSHRVLRAGPEGGTEHESVWAADADGDLTARFAQALRQARRRAGDPTYDDLAALTDYSTQTVSRAFAGRTLPKWSVVERVLAVLGMSGDDVVAEWREQWARAQDQRRPVTAAPAGPAPGAPVSGDAAGSRQVLPGPAPSVPAGSGQVQGTGRECEDCGALVGNIVQHQAWHWRIDKQLRRSVIRAVDSTGQ